MSKKLVFFHDGPRWKNQDGLQFGNSSDLDIYKRYLYLAENISFCMRVFETQKTDKLTNLNAEGLFITEIAPFNRPRKIINFFKSKNKIKCVVEGADLIIVRLPSTIGSIAYWYAKKINKPILVEVVACPSDTLSNHSFLGKLYSKMAARKLKKIMNDARFSIYVTQNFLQSRYPTFGKSIGISDVILKNVESKNPRIGYYNNLNVYCINLGTLAVIDLKYKGHDIVIKALGALKKKNNKIKYNYYIAGKGNPERLKRLAEKFNVLDNVIFLGLLDHSKIYQFFNKIDLYVHPSRVEGLPRAVIEAMSFGCPVIGSNMGGIPELLNKDVIFTSDSVISFSNKLKMFDNKEIFVKNSIFNHEKSKEFEFHYLEKKRNQFYKEFLETI